MEKLGCDVFGLILGHLNTKSILNMAQTNKAINDLCKKTKMLEKRAFNYVSSHTPWFAPVGRIQDCALLIKRGYTTTYTVVWTDGIPVSKSTDVVFGAPARSDQDFALEIRGLPPPKGTRVWAIVDTDAEDHRIPYAEVYWSKEEIINAWDAEDSNFLDYLKDCMDDVGETKESIFKQLFDGKMTYGTIIREVILP